jgi:ribosomal protein S18 acetylase RimI-like enzyme
MPLTIRPIAGPSEVDACARIMAASEPWITLGRDIRSARKTMADASRERYVALDDGELAGFVILNLGGPLAGYLQTICVAPEYRGRGVGTELMRFLEDRIFRDHASVYLMVSSFNTSARRLYERLGYTLIGELSDYLIDGHAELLMRKRRTAR